MVNYYWVAGDTYDGNDIDETFRTLEAARAYYETAKGPYKKIEHVYDGDPGPDMCAVSSNGLRGYYSETIATYRDGAYFAEYYSDLKR